MTAATMSTILIAFVIAAICQLGTMGEEEKVSGYSSSLDNVSDEPTEEFCWQETIA